MMIKFKSDFEGKNTQAKMVWNQDNIDKNFKVDIFSIGKESLGKIENVLSGLSEEDDTDVGDWGSGLGDTMGPIDEGDDDCAGYVYGHDNPWYEDEDEDEDDDDG